MANKWLIVVHEQSKLMAISINTRYYAIALCRSAKLTAAWLNDAVINFEWFQWDDRYLKAAATASSNGNDEQRGLLFTKAAIFLLK